MSHKEQREKNIEVAKYWIKKLKKKPDKIVLAVMSALTATRRTALDYIEVAKFEMDKNG